jgi:hypothetical protein
VAQKISEDLNQRSKLFAPGTKSYIDQSKVPFELWKLVLRLKTHLLVGIFRRKPRLLDQSPELILNFFYSDRRLALVRTS